MMPSFNLRRAVLVLAATCCNAVSVNLGDAKSFAILTKTGVTNVPLSTITGGHVGVSPIDSTAITGFGLIYTGGKYARSSQVLNGVGRVYASDYDDPVFLSGAVADMQVAYNFVEALANFPDETDFLAGSIGGATLTPGVYAFSTSLDITSDVTFAGSGEFFITTTGNVVVAAGLNVILSDGALAENIYWQVAGNVAVGAGSVMQGTLLVMNSVAFITGSTLNGRVLAQKACTLQMATITAP